MLLAMYLICILGIIGGLFGCWLIVLADRKASAREAGNRVEWAQLRKEYEAVDRDLTELFEIAGLTRLPVRVTQAMRS